MARRARTPERIDPLFDNQRGLAVLKGQMEALQKLKGLRHDEARHNENEWYDMTKRFLDMAFGFPNPHTQNLGRARSAGEYYVRPFDFGGEDPQDQVNYGERVTAYERALGNAITELTVLLPEPQIKGTYEPGDEYAFYRDLKGVLLNAQREVFLIDAYLNAQIFELYGDVVPHGITLRMLTNNPSGTLITIAKMFAGRGNFELRSSTDVHDRVVFVDDRCWVIGQSIKDAAKKKPTYMVEHENPKLMYSIYDQLWQKAAVVVP